MALQGESLRPSAVWYLLFLLSQLSFSLSLSLFFPRVCPTKSHRIESIYCQISGDTRHRQNKSKPSLNLILFARCYFFSFSFSSSVLLCKSAGTTQTRNIQIHTCAHCVWKGFFNGIWRFQFPLCHQRQKTLWAQLPLSHTHPDKTTHTHSQTLTCNHRNTHVHAHLKLLWHSRESHNQSHASEVRGVFVKSRFYVIEVNRMGVGGGRKTERSGGKWSVRKRSGHAEKDKGGQTGDGKIEEA